MQSFTHISTQLELLTSEIDEIFFIMDKIPYDVMLKIIGLNSVLSDKENPEGKKLLMEIAKEIGITEDRLRSLDISRRLVHFSKMVTDLFGALEKEKEFAADDMMPVLIELINRTKKDNVSAIKKLKSMKKYCEKLSKGLKETSYHGSIIGYGLAQFTAGIAFLTDPEIPEKDKVDEKIAEKVDKLQGKKLLVPKKRRVPKIHKKRINKLSDEFSKRNQLKIKKALADINQALKDNNIENAMNSFSALGKCLVSDVGKKFLMDIPASEISEVPPLELLFALEALKSVNPDNSLQKGIATYIALLGQKYDVALSVISEDKIRKDGLAIFPKLVEWSLAQKAEAVVNSADSEIKFIKALEVQIDALKKTAEHFENVFDQARVVKLANELQRELVIWAGSENKSDKTYSKLKAMFSQKINECQLSNELSGFKNIIYAMKMIIDNAISSKKVDLAVDKKEEKETKLTFFKNMSSEYSFYKAKRNMSNQLQVIDTLIPGKKQMKK